MRTRPHPASRVRHGRRRDVEGAVQAIEREIEAQVAVNDAARANKPAMSDLEIARRIAFALELGRRELVRQKGEATCGE